MPLVPTFMSTQMCLKGSLVSLTGEKYAPFVSCISNATAQYVLSAAVVNSVNNALGPGAGTFSGRISGLSSVVLSNLMLVKAAASLLAGRDIKKLLDSVAFGVVQAMNTVIIQGTVIGAGPGTGTGRIYGLVPSALEALILAQVSLRMLMGRDMRKLISAIAFGICNHIMMSGVITTICIGAVAGPPAGPIMIPAAPGFGRLV